MAESQQQRIAKELLRISQDVTTEDRQKFMEFHGCTKGSVSQYLNGTVYSVDTGLKMLSFFKNRIKSREIRIKKHTETGKIL